MVLSHQTGVRIPVALLASISPFSLGFCQFDEIGNYDLTIEPEGHGLIKDFGKYLVIWKKSMDGAWKLHVDIWNTSRPA